MPIDRFIAALNNHLPLTENYRDFLRVHVHTIHARTKDELLPHNHHRLVFFFVAKGLIYSWGREASGIIVPTHFVLEQQMIGTSIHPLHRELIPDGISALEDSILVTGEIAISDEAIVRFPEAQQLISLMVNDGQRSWQKINRALFQHDAVKRVQSLREIAPELFKRVPDQLLASYLHLSRGHFNRIKNSGYKGPH